MTNFTSLLRSTSGTLHTSGITLAIVTILSLTPCVRSAEFAPIFNGKNLKNWRVATVDEFVQRGKVEVVDGAIVLHAGQPGNGIRYTGPLPRLNYEIRWEAQRVAGFDFFSGLTFPVGTNQCTFIPGGWDGDITGLSNINHLSANQNETTRPVAYQQNRWYQFRLRVEEHRIRVWLDEQALIDVNTQGKTLGIRATMQPMCPLGFCSWYTTARIRGVALRNLPPATPLQNKKRNLR